MTARAPRRTSSRVAALAAALVAVTTLACGGAASFEIPIETPIQPKLDVTPFQRVLIAGFVAGGSDDVDTNQETVRLLRSQLRSKSSLRVIDADAMPLIDIAQEQSHAAASDGTGPAPAGQATAEKVAQTLPKQIREEKDLEPYERLFANTAYWKRIGEEYQNPLIVTGTVLFTPQSRSGFVTRDTEQFNGVGGRSVVPTRTYMERKGFILRPKFVFIRPLGRHDVFGELPRGSALQPAADHAGAVVVLRADGQARAELPQHAQQPEGPRHAGPAQIALARRISAAGLVFFCSRRSETE